MSAISRGFDLAMAAATFSTAPRIGLKVGAALLSGSRILSMGSNRWHTHPDSDNAEFTRSLHAENVALLRRQHYAVPSRLTLFVARQREDGSLGCSRPCSNCMRLAHLAGVRRIWYINENGKQETIKL